MEARERRFELADDLETLEAPDQDIRYEMPNEDPWDLLPSYCASQEPSDEEFALELPGRHHVRTPKRRHKEGSK